MRYFKIEVPQAATNLEHLRVAAELETGDVHVVLEGVERVDVDPGVAPHGVTKTVSHQFERLLRDVRGGAGRQLRLDQLAQVIEVIQALGVQRHDVPRREPKR